MKHLILFFAIPFIGIFDYLLFRKWTMCEKCGHQINSWYAFIIPTSIEIMLFFAGIIIGYSYF